MGTTVQRPTVPTGVVVPNLQPGSPEWLKTASASKVAAMLGLSPWDSPFSLWHKMNGTLVEPQEPTDVQARGHYIEPALRQWFTDTNPGVNVSRGASFAHRDRPWQTATPDGLIWARSTQPRVTALLECKTALLDWEWGPSGTDQIPPYYRVQAMWQMDVTGVHVARFAVLTSHWEFRHYTLEYDHTEADEIRAQVEQFMASLHAGQAPPIDGASATYRAIRDLHPDIDDVDVEIDPSLAVRYVNAATAVEFAADDMAAAAAELAEAMGSARRAVLTLNDGTVHVLATRQSRSGTTPFLKRASALTRTFHLLPKKEAS